MSLLTVITVTKDNLEGLKRTGASLRAQSFQSFEWLVIDGASQDGTVDFLKSCGAAYTSEPDSGIYDAMNKGIDRASGFYLLFLNAGDCLADEHIFANIVSYIEEIQETPDFIYGDALEAASGEAPHDKPARPYTRAAYGMFTHHQAMLYRRDLLDGLRYDTSYRIAADYKFTLQFLKRSNTVVYCPFPICLFESGGISQQQATLGRNEQIRARQECALVSPLKNRWVAFRQHVAWIARQMFPALYWRLQSRSKNPLA